MRIKTRATLILIAAAILAALQSQGLSAAERLRSYAVDPRAISISGISSGGFMAIQFHVAHSATVMGAGIIAGGPYQCARVNSGFGSYLGSYKELWNAIYVCSHQAGQIPFIGFLQPFLGPPDPEKSAAAARAEAETGAIDPLENMRGDRVWLFSGTRDTLVLPSVMDAVDAFYKELLGAFAGAPDDTMIVYVNDVDVHHAMVVATEGDNNCLDFALPYINDCDYDAAGNILNYFYGQPGGSLNQPGEWDRQSLITFDQTEFFPEGTGRNENGDGSISMNDIGHVYVPADCHAGACGLHVALHGCEQYQEKVEKECGREGACPPHLFFEAAGYNEWAEANDIIILYPQTTTWEGPSVTRTNPKGCWDWWGYTGEDYATQNGKQVRAIKSMIDRLARR